MTALLAAFISLLPLVLADDSQCPLGQGYWTNHPQNWPVDELELGGQLYTQAELLALLADPTVGDASLILARQLIAAKLNVAGGVDATLVATVLADADALLTGFEGKLPYGVAPSSTAGAQMTIAGTTLDVFNSGVLTEGCQSDDDSPEATPEPEATPDPGADDDTPPVIIVIEGPVTAININIITIFSINIVVDASDPILTVIQIGDIVRVVGEIDDDDDDLLISTGGSITIVIVAITVVIINVEVYISNDGLVWRDPGNCRNAPPPWAPAHGWRTRCDNRSGPGSGSNSDSRSDSRS